MQINKSYLKNTDSKIKLIMIDAGGVILDYNSSAHYALMAKKAGVNARTFVPEVNRLIGIMESGSITLKKATAELSKKFDVPLSSIKWGESLREAAKPNLKVMELVEKLHDNFSIAIATNTEFYAYRIMFGSNGILQNLTYDKVFASCYMKVQKPKTEYYKYILDRTGVEASEAIFIDDRQSNINGAQLLKINTVLFTNYDDLVKSLKPILRK
jgi:HAD superfamily hydrolase (TIGR01509 family)